MITRISAEFETPDLAELALKRIKESVNGVYSTNIIYNKTSDKALKLKNGSIYTVIPTAVTTHTYFTAVMESPASENVISEPLRSRKAIVYVICEDDSINNIRAVLNAMGGLNISVPQKSE